MKILKIKTPNTLNIVVQKQNLILVVQMLI